MNYIIEIKKYILLATIIFILSMIVGALISFKEEKKSEDVAKEISSIIPKKTTKLEQITIIIRNNILNSFLSLFLSAGIMIYDGLTFGMIFKFMGGHGYIYLFGIIPHFIIEMSAIIISVSIGLRFGHIFLKWFIGKLTDTEKVKIEKELKNGMSIYVKLIIPMIVLAAFVEIFVTPILFKMLR